MSAGNTPGGLIFEKGFRLERTTPSLVDGEMPIASELIHFKFEDNLFSWRDLKLIRIKDSRESDGEFHLMDVGDWQMEFDRGRAMSGAVEHIFAQRPESFSRKAIQVEYSGDRLETERVIGSLKYLTLKNVLAIYERRKKKDTATLNKLSDISQYINRNAKVFSVFHLAKGLSYLNLDRPGNEPSVLATISYHAPKKQDSGSISEKPLGIESRHEIYEKMLKVNPWLNYPLFLSLDSIRQVEDVYREIQRKTRNVKFVELSRGVKFKTMNPKLTHRLFSLVLLRCLDQAAEDGAGVVILKADSSNTVIFEEIYGFEVLTRLTSSLGTYNILGLKITDDPGGPYQKLRMALTRDVESLFITNDILGEYERSKVDKK